MAIGLTSNLFVLGPTNPFGSDEEEKEVPARPKKKKKGPTTNPFGGMGGEEDKPKKNSQDKPVDPPKTPSGGKTDPKKGKPAPPAADPFSGAEDPSEDDDIIIEDDDVSGDPAAETDPEDDNVPGASEPAEVDPSEPAVTGGAEDTGATEIETPPAEELKVVVPPPVKKKTSAVVAKKVDPAPDPEPAKPLGSFSRKDLHQAIELATLEQGRSRQTKVNSNLRNLGHLGSVVEEIINHRKVTSGAWFAGSALGSYPEGFRDWFQDFSIEFEKVHLVALLGEAENYLEAHPSASVSEALRDAIEATSIAEAKLLGWKILGDPQFQTLLNISRESKKEIYEQDLLKWAKGPLWDAGFHGSAYQVARELQDSARVGAQAKEFLGLSDGRAHWTTQLSFQGRQTFHEMTDAWVLPGFIVAPYFGFLGESFGLARGWRAGAALSSIAGEAGAFSAVSSIGQGFSREVGVGDWAAHTASSSVMFLMMRGVHKGTGWVRAKSFETPGLSRHPVPLPKRAPVPGGKVQISGTAKPYYPTLPNERILTAAQPAFRRLTGVGKVLNWTLHHGGGISVMRTSSLVSGGLHLIPGEEANSEGHAWLQAGLAHLHAHVGARVANGLTGMQSTLAQMRMHRGHYDTHFTRSLQDETARIPGRVEAALQKQFRLRDMENSMGLPEVLPLDLPIAEIIPGVNGAPKFLEGDKIPVNLVRYRSPDGSYFYKVDKSSLPEGLASTSTSSGKVRPMDGRLVALQEALKPDKSFLFDPPRVVRTIAEAQSHQAQRNFGYAAKSVRQGYDLLDRYLRPAQSKDTDPTAAGSTRPEARSEIDPSRVNPLALARASELFTLVNGSEVTIQDWSLLEALVRATDAQEPFEAASGGVNRLFRGAIYNMSEQSPLPRGLMMEHKYYDIDGFTVKAYAIAPQTGGHGQHALVVKAKPGSKLLVNGAEIRGGEAVLRGGDMITVNGKHYYYASPREMAEGRSNPGSKPPASDRLDPDATRDDPRATPTPPKPPQTPAGQDNPHWNRLLGTLRSNGNVSLSNVRRGGDDNPWAVVTLTNNKGTDFGNPVEVLGPPRFAVGRNPNGLKGHGFTPVETTEIPLHDVHVLVFQDSQGRWHVTPGQERAQVELAGNKLVSTGGLGSLENVRDLGITGTDGQKYFIEMDFGKLLKQPKQGAGLATKAEGAAATPPPPPPRPAAASQAPTAGRAGSPTRAEGRRSTRPPVPFNPAGLSPVDALNTLGQAGSAAGRPDLGMDSGTTRSEPTREAPTRPGSGSRAAEGPTLEVLPHHNEKQASLIRQTIGLKDRWSKAGDDLFEKGRYHLVYDDQQVPIHVIDTHLEVGQSRHTTEIRWFLASKEIELNRRGQAPQDGDQPTFPAFSAGARSANSRSSGEGTIGTDPTMLPPGGDSSPTVSRVGSRARAASSGVGSDNPVVSGDITNGAPTRVPATDTVPHGPPSAMASGAQRPSVAGEPAEPPTVPFPQPAPVMGTGRPADQLTDLQIQADRRFYPGHALDNTSADRLVTSEPRVGEHGLQWVSRHHGQKSEISISSLGDEVPTDMLVISLDAQSGLAHARTLARSIVDQAKVPVEVVVPNHSAAGLDQVYVGVKYVGGDQGQVFTSTQKALYAMATSNGRTEDFGFLGKRRILLSDPAQGNFPGEAIGHAKLDNGTSPIIRFNEEMDTVTP